MNVSVLVAGIAFGLVVAFYISAFISSRFVKKISEKHDYKLTSKKKKGKIEIVKLVEETNRVTNSDVQRLLKVSNATTVRYLNELEMERVIKRMSKTGKKVYYELK